jgi:hypothetical protein
MQIECDYVSINVELLLIFLPKKTKLLLNNPKKNCLWIYIYIYTKGKMKKRGNLKL